MPTRPGFFVPISLERLFVQDPDDPDPVSPEELREGFYAFQRTLEDWLNDVPPLIEESSLWEEVAGVLQPVSRPDRFEVIVDEDLNLYGWDGDTYIYLFDDGSGVDPFIELVATGEDSFININVDGANGDLNSTVGRDHNFEAGNDCNVTAGNDVNISADNDMNLSATNNVNVSWGGVVNLVQDPAGSDPLVLGGGPMVFCVDDAAPADASITALRWSGSPALAMWVNEAGNVLTFRVRYVGGTFKTGTIALA